MYQLKDYVPSQRALDDLGIGALERWSVGEKAPMLQRFNVRFNSRGEVERLPPMLI